MGDRPTADQLIGEQQPLQPKTPTDLRLSDCGNRDGPGAVSELPAEELRTHGRLAVGRDEGAAHLEEPRHPAAISVDDIAPLYR